MIEVGLNRPKPGDSMSRDDRHPHHTLTTMGTSRDRHPHHTLTTMGTSRDRHPHHTLTTMGTSRRSSALLAFLGDPYSMRFLALLASLLDTSGLPSTATEIKRHVTYGPFPPMTFFLHLAPFHQ
jgi:hypothetical protein